MTSTKSNTCPRCGAAFACGMQTGQEPCWCAALPTLHALPDGMAGCYCPACLKQLVDAQQEKPGSPSASS